VIRRARSAEAAPLRALVERAYAPWIPAVGWRPMPMDDDYTARIAAGEAWVLEEAGAIHGVLVLKEHADHLLLDNVAVEPARKGTGVGRSLLDFAEAEAWRRGLPEIRLYTNENMEQNIALYAARGYAETGRRREKGFCRVFMTKRTICCSAL
jgi:ribosomal protein S18 acetylase RimI-like enzyme